MMTTEELRAAWDAHISKFPLSEEQAGLWLGLHNDETIMRGLNATFWKWNRDGFRLKMNEDYLIRYTSKTLNNIKARTLPVNQ
jgi:hypothetical protein